MPSFDVVSSIDMHEVTNAVDQVKREIGTRYDFRGSKTEVELEEAAIKVLADDEMRLQAVQGMLREKLAKRSVSLKSVVFKDPEKAGGDMLRQTIELKKSLTTDEVKRLAKVVKEMKLKKVSGSNQGEQLRVSGPKKDALQEVIAKLKEEANDLDLQFVNFRD